LLLSMYNYGSQQKENKTSSSKECIQGSNNKSCFLDKICFMVLHFHGIVDTPHMSLLLVINR
jgi:hypothetical protein